MKRCGAAFPSAAAGERGCAGASALGGEQPAGKWQPRARDDSGPIPKGPEKPEAVTLGTRCRSGRCGGGRKTDRPEPLRRLGGPRAQRGQRGGSRGFASGLASHCCVQSPGLAGSSDPGAGGGGRVASAAGDGREAPGMPGLGAVAVLSVSGLGTQFVTCRRRCKSCLSRGLGPITRCKPAWEVDGGSGPLGHPRHQVLGSGQRNGASRSPPCHQVQAGLGGGRRDRASGSLLGQSSPGLCCTHKWDGLRDHLEPHRFLPASAHNRLLCRIDSCDTNHRIDSCDTNR